VKRCSSCVAGHRKRAPSANGLTSGLLLRRSQVRVLGARQDVHALAAT
jgi:hypothetical protein